MRRNKFISFTIRLLLVFAVLFPMHSFLQATGSGFSFDNLLFEAYFANFTLVIVSYYFLIRLKEKYASSLGFLFLAAFVLKLIVFFIFFSPIYKADEITQRVEFLAFFVPYAIALTLETISLVRVLNKD